MGDSPEWVTVARLTRARGNKGELSAVPLTDHPERYQRLTTVRVGARDLEVERVWYHMAQPVFKFRGIDAIGDAETLAGKDVQVPAAERFPLPEGEYYFGDLIDCNVIDNSNAEPIGMVTGWQELGGPVLLELNDGKLLIPFAKSIVKQIDLANKLIRVVLPEGLVDLQG